MTLLHTITHPSRIHDILFCHTPDLDRRDDRKGELLLVGAEDRKLSVYHIGPGTGSGAEEQQPRIIAEMIGHTSRFVVVFFSIFLSSLTKFGI
jgi:protein MAK11